MNATRGEAAWTDYWTSDGATGGGCLPGGLGRRDGPLARPWREAARALRRGATILDLGTGDGIVLRILQEERRDLKLVGVDSAARLPAAPKGIDLRAGIRMEALPFANGSIDLATSQFGFEYGDTAPIAAELGRVVAAKGRFRFIVHHADSAIVEHNGARRAALAWAAGESGLIERARAFAAARQRMVLPIPPSFRQAIGQAQRAHPGQPVAAEFTAAVLQVLEFGQSAPGGALSALSSLEAKARHEIARIDALRSAACDAERIGVMSEALRRAGFAPENPLILPEPDGRPLAWNLAGAKS